MAGISFLRARSPVTPNTTSAHGSGTRGSRRSRGSRSGLGIMRRPRGGWRSAVPSSEDGTAGRSGRRPESAGATSGLLLEFAAHGGGQLVPGVDELLHGLFLEHTEDVVEVDA